LANLSYAERKFWLLEAKLRLVSEAFEHAGRLHVSRADRRDAVQVSSKRCRSNAQLNRKKLEDEYLALRQKLDLEMEAEVAAMSDEELEREE
jgi:hypothetical protein